jgi:hypothetical protein
MAAVSFSQALLDDTAQRLTYKIAVAMFSAGSNPKFHPRMDDTQQRLTWKIVSLLSPVNPRFTPRLDDTLQRLLWKWCSVLFVSGSSPKFAPRMDDTQQRLLWKIASLLLGTDTDDSQWVPRLDDTQQRLLWKISSISQEVEPPSGNPPNKAVNPNPTAGATGIAVTGTSLSWQNGGGASTYRVWFNGVLQGTQAGTTFSLGTGLLNSTVYSWRIDSINAEGTTIGDTWTFTTAAIAFAFTPATQLVHWTQLGNETPGLTGTLAQFNATADKPNVFTIDFSHADSLSVTSVTGLQALPALFAFDCQDQVITSLDASNCPKLSAMQVQNNPNLAGLNITGCTELTTVSCANGGALVSLIGLNTCAAMTDFSCLSSSLPSLDCTGLAALTNLEGSLSSVGSVNITGCTALTFFHFGVCPNLTTIVGGGVLTFVDVLSLEDNPGLTVLNFPSLVSVGSNLNMAGNSSMTSLSMPALVACAFYTGALSGCNLTGNLNLSSLLDIPTRFDGAGNPLLTSITLNPALNFSGSTSQNVVGAAIAFPGCGLNQFTVDTLLVIAANSGFGAHDTIDISGGTNAAPGPASATALATLSANGCPVSTN